MIYRILGMEKAAKDFRKHDMFYSRKWGRYLQVKLPWTIGFLQLFFLTASVGREKLGEKRKLE